MCGSKSFIIKNTIVLVPETFGSYSFWIELHLDPIFFSSKNVLEPIVIGSRTVGSNMCYIFWNPVYRFRSFWFEKLAVPKAFESDTC